MELQMKLLGKAKGEIKLPEKVLLIYSVHFYEIL